MIPKIIHFVWLGGGKYPAPVQDCINSWKRIMPDYTIKRWDETNFDIDSVPWVKEAIQMRKWSLASDYIRHFALYTEGGIYMDTDVKVFRPFDEFLSWDFFSSVEYHPTYFLSQGIHQIDDAGAVRRDGDIVAGLGLLAALIASKKANPFIKECLDYYGSRHFIQEDGSLYVDVINPGIMAMLATKYGFRYKDENQLLDGNMMVYSSSIFAGDPATRSKESYSMHYCDGSWREKTLKTRMKDYIKRILYKKRK